MSDEVEKREEPTNEKAEEATPETVLVEGLFCFHAISSDKSQRFCTYRLYGPNTNSGIVAQDARDWFRLSMRISEVNESFSLIINKVC